MQKNFDDISLDKFLLEDAIVKYESFSRATSSAWQGPAITKKLFSFILKFFSKCSPTNKFVSGIIPFIAEIIIFFEMSTEILLKTLFANSEGMAIINTSDSSQALSISLIRLIRFISNSTELR